MIWRSRQLSFSIYANFLAQMEKDCKRIVSYLAISFLSPPSWSGFHIGFTEPATVMQGMARSSIGPVLLKSAPSADKRATEFHALPPLQ